MRRAGFFLVKTLVMLGLPSLLSRYTDSFGRDKMLRRLSRANDYLLK